MATETQPESVLPNTLLTSCRIANAEQHGDLGQRIIQA